MQNCVGPTAGRQVECLHTRVECAHHDAPVGILRQRPNVVALQRTAPLAPHRPTPTLVAGQPTFERAEPKRPVAGVKRTDHHVRTQPGLLASEVLTLPRQPVVADNARIVGAAPEVAQWVLDHRTHVAQTNQLETLVGIPVIDGAVAVGAHPERVVRVNGDGQNGVFGQSALFVGRGRELFQQVLVPVHHDQAVVVGGHPEPLALVEFQVAHDDTLEVGFQALGGKEVGWRLKPPLVFGRIDPTPLARQVPHVALRVGEPRVTVFGRQPLGCLGVGMAVEQFGSRVENAITVLGAHPDAALLVFADGFHVVVEQRLFVAAVRKVVAETVAVETRKARGCAKPHIAPRILQHTVHLRIGQTHLNSNRTKTCITARINTPAAHNKQHEKEDIGRTAEQALHGAQRAEQTAQRA